LGLSFVYETRQKTFKKKNKKRLAFINEFNTRTNLFGPVTCLAVIHGVHFTQPSYIYIYIYKQKKFNFFFQKSKIGF
jgi:hypothetical protein